MQGCRLLHPRSESRGVKMIEATAGHVDRAWRKHVGVSSGCLVGLRGLNALLEAAAVRDAAEGTRNVLRVVYIAEAEEDLIFFARD